MYGKWDIVRRIGVDESHYYIINNIYEDNPMIYEDNADANNNVEITLIYPITGREETETVNRDDLKLIAKYPSKIHFKMLEYVKIQRDNLGLIHQPDYLKNIDNYNKSYDDRKNEVDNTYSDSKKKITKTLDRKEFHRMLRSDEGRRRIERNLKELDKQLDFLYISMKKGDKVEIEIHKKRLEEIRSNLMELEHYKLNDAKGACNCPACRE